MRKSQNEVFITGRLVADVVAKEAENGSLFAYATVMDNVDDYFDDKTKEWVSRPNPNFVVAYGSVAETFQYGKKGDLVHLQGRIRSTQKVIHGEKYTQTNVKILFHSPFVPPKSSPDVDECELERQAVQETENKRNRKTTHGNSTRKTMSEGKTNVNYAVNKELKKKTSTHTESRRNYELEENSSEFKGLTPFQVNEIEDLVADEEISLRDKGYSQRAIEKKLDRYQKELVGEYLEDNQDRTSADVVSETEFLEDEVSNEEITRYTSEL